MDSLLNPFRGLPLDDDDEIELHHDTHLRSTSHSGMRGNVDDPTFYGPDSRLDAAWNAPQPPPPHFNGAGGHPLQGQQYPPAPAFQGSSTTLDHVNPFYSHEQGNPSYASGMRNEYEDDKIPLTGPANEKYGYQPPSSYR